MRIRSSLAVLLLLPLLFVATAAPDAALSPPPQTPHARVSEQSLFETLRELESFGNRTTPDKQNAVADYLQRRLQQYSNVDVLFHHYRAGGQGYRNVVARFPGKKDPGAVLIFSAHYDSHPDGLARAGAAPGVDDNATGVAVLLEAARRLSTGPVARTIELVFFSNEEQGHQGSKAYVETLVAEGRKVSGVINIDTIGYAKPPLARLWREAGESRGLFGRVWYLLKQALKKPVHYIQSGFRSSDEILLVAGRPASGPFVEKIHSLLRGAEVATRKDIGPQCG